jgi:glycosyltransferase involved in cell wall biosynthesis
MEAVTQPAPPPRVLFLVGTLHAGGLERYVTQMALTAKRQGTFEPAVLCTSKRAGIFARQLEAEGVPLYEAPSRWNRDPRALLGLRALVAGFRPDIVHSQVNDAMLQQALAVLGTGGRPRYCVTERNCYERHGLARARRMAQYHVLRALGCDYSANADAVATHLARMVHDRRDRIQVIPNGVLAPSAEEASGREALRSELGAASGEVVLVCVARLDKHKGHARVLRAHAALRRQGLPVSLWLLGDGVERAALGQLAAELGTATHVRFLGVVANVRRYLPASDVFVLLSDHEGMPNAVIEAMSAGLPVVATAVGGVPEALDDGRAGILVAPDADDATITAHLAGLVGDPARRRALGEVARQRAQASYSLDAAFDRLLRHYEGILGRHLH